MPGGCNLGPRPIDQHLKVFSALGAEDSVDSVSYTHLDVYKRQKLELVIRWYVSGNAIAQRIKVTLGITG